MVGSSHLRSLSTQLISFSKRDTVSDSFIPRWPKVSCIDGDAWFLCWKKKFVARFVAHASHIQQACDVKIYKCVKTEWRKVVLQHQQSSTEPITRIIFAPFFPAAHANVAKPASLQLCKMLSDALDFTLSIPENVDYSIGKKKYRGWRCQCRKNRYRKNVSLTRSLMGFLIKIGETPEQNTSPH